MPGFLDDLRAAIKDGSFRPLLVRERRTPKPGGSGKVRKLGIPKVADRVVQAALKLVLEPIFETDFLPVSYGFRPKPRAQDAVAEIHYFGTRGYRWVAHERLARRDGRRTVDPIASVFVSPTPATEVLGDPATAPLAADPRSALVAARSGRRSCALGSIAVAASMANCPHPRDAAAERQSLAATVVWRIPPQDQRAARASRMPRRSCRDAPGRLVNARTSSVVSSGRTARASTAA